MNSRNKGHTYERQIRKELRKYYYPDCETSRYASKYTDDVEKRDFTKSGFLGIQAKALERTPPYHDILSEMPDDDKYNVIFHKRNHKGEVVVMKKEDFYELLDIMLAHGVKI